jgi:hypothetical protein
MKRIVTISLITLAFSFLAFLIVGAIYAALTKPDWETIDSKTIGTITKISPGRGGGAWFTYMSDGEMHEEFDGLYQYGMTLGEKYWIKYCSTCSSTFTSKIKAIEYLPVFTEDETYLETTAKITRIYKFRWLGNGADTGIEFTYVAGESNESFERSQTLPPNYIEKYPDLKVGQEYKVRVWTVDHRRAILDLDSPIK